MDFSYNIVTLIEQTPISRLDKKYNNKFLNKIKENFTESQQQLFISSFYCYLNYNQETEFIIDLDKVWNWLGFSQKTMAKRLLEKNFIINKDYKILSKDEINTLSEGRGGHNREIIMMNIKTFKLCCIKADTKKATEIHEYFLKMEQLLYEIINEETDELKQQIKQQKEELEKQKEEMGLIQLSSKVPVIYIYNINTKSDGVPSLKIGVTHSLMERIKPYKTISPFGSVVFHQKIEDPNINIKTLENMIHLTLLQYKIAGEMFQIDVNKAITCVQSLYITQKTFLTGNEAERDQQIKKLHDRNSSLLEPAESTEQLRKIHTCNSSTQTDYDELDPVTTPIIQGNHDIIQKFDQFINQYCIVHPDADVSAKDIIGQYRLHCREAKREITQSFTDYLKRRFVYGKVKDQNKDQVIYGFTGVRLKEIQYTYLSVPPTEHDLFFLEKCVYAPGGTALHKDILKEYHDWRRTLQKPPPTSQEEEQLKKYLKTNPHLLFETVWTTSGNGQGYYGVTLKHETKLQRKSSTGCKVKKLTNDGHLITEYDTIAKAAESEGWCTAKMSRAIKSKTIFGTAPNTYFFEKIDKKSASISP